MQSETKSCQNCKKDFTIEPDDFNFYEKIKVPSPTWCPECRLQRRLITRNERALHKRKCDLCEKDSISLYAPESGVINYCVNCWWGDKWDARNYAMEYDFSKPFFTQFAELMRKVPFQERDVSHRSLKNSHFTNMNHGLKDCYYIFNSDYDEKCMYGEELENSTECVDTTMADGTQFSYESLNCNKCYQIYYSVDCESSHDIWFSKNLVGCANCFGCVNLRDQNYCIFNDKYTKEEYHEKLNQLNLGSYSEVQKLKSKARDFWLKFPNKYMHGYQNLDSSGDYVFYSRYVKNSFITTGSEYCKYCMWLIVKNNKDCYDFTQFGENSELVYESLICGKNVSRVVAGINCLDGHDMYYCMWCRGDNLFGCIGMTKKQYAILNKEYSKEEYEKLLPRIIKHMREMPYVDKKGRKYMYGDFYPGEISRFAYNETSAQEYFPLTREEAQEQGYVWREEKDRNYKITIEPRDLPDDIKDVTDDIIKQVIGCEHAGECKEQCTTAFRIIDSELNFYRSQNLPLPRLCPNCRHYQRVKFRNQPKYCQRTCMCDKKHSHHKDKCEVEFETSYAPDRPEIVYCERCYQQEVY